MIIILIILIRSHCYCSLEQWISKMRSKWTQSWLYTYKLLESVCMIQPQRWYLFIDGSHNGIADCQLTSGVVANVGTGTAAAHGASWNWILPTTLWWLPVVELNVSGPFFKSVNGSPLLSSVISLACVSTMVLMASVAISALVVSTLESNFSSAYGSTSVASTTSASISASGMLPLSKYTHFCMFFSKFLTWAYEDDSKSFCLPSMVSKRMSADFWAAVLNGIPPTSSGRWGTIFSELHRTKKQNWLVPIRQ